MVLDWIASIIQITLVDLVLSGDNAMVIALVASGLPREKRRLAMVGGTGLAITMRLILTLVVSYLLLIPGLRFIGALLLAFIACKLLQEQSRPRSEQGPAPTSVATAISRIALADLIMSLDNVIAIAGVAHSDPLRLVFGLAMSIGMILALSSAIVAMIARFRWLVYLGTGVLALAAADMMVHDLEIARHSAVAATFRSAELMPTTWPMRFFVVTGCLTSIFWWPKKRDGEPSIGCVPAVTVRSQ